MEEAAETWPRMAYRRRRAMWSGRLGVPARFRVKFCARSFSLYGSIFLCAYVPRGGSARRAR
jgi:hypothetical protein